MCRLAAVVLCALFAQSHAGIPIVQDDASKFPICEKYSPCSDETCLYDNENRCYNHQGFIYCCLDDKETTTPVPTFRKILHGSVQAEIVSTESSSEECVDKLDSCASVTSQCTNPTMAVMMRTNCAKTCNMCDMGPKPVAPQEQLTPDCVDKLDSCGSVISQCTNPTMAVMMRNNCAKTCNMCDDKTPQVPTPPPNKETSTTCMDKLDTCASMTNSCYDPPMKTIMTNNCAKTCGFCDSNNVAPIAPNTDTSPAPECIDKLDTCSSMASHCTEPKMTAIMTNNCVRTCGLCGGNGPAPAPKPTEECVDKLDSCGSYAGLCTDPKMSALLTSNCAKTCGFCGGSPSGCTDKLLTCSSYIGSCNDPKMSAMLTTNCAKTCGKCGGPAPAETCTDKLNNCSSYASKCNDAQMGQLLSENCAKTCGKCGAPSQTLLPADCKDKSPRCADWGRNGFCTSSFYPLEHRRSTCARTCSLC